MNEPIQPTQSRGRIACRTWITLLGPSALVLFILFAHPFLAPNEPVDAPVLVVEGWVPDYVLKEAVSEFELGHYTRVLISGLEEPKSPEGSDAARAANHLITLGLDRSNIEVCPAQETGWNRTGAMARGVRDRRHNLGLKPKEINVIALGPHARQTCLAFRRLIDLEILVGVISVPKDDYISSRWWASAAGIKKMTKDFAASVKEIGFGPRF